MKESMIIAAKMRKLVLSLLMLCCIPLAGFAQDKQIVAGHIVDNDGPLAGVNVFVNNAQNRTLSGGITDRQGNYVIRLPENTDNLTLVFSYIGMKTQRIKYTGQPRIDLRMLDDDNLLESVEITARRLERNDLGISSLEQISATAKIEMSELIETTPVTSLQEALQGQLAGVDITVGGDPGSRSTIRIRGMNTLNGNAEPLFVIDGVPQNVDMSDDFDLTNANEEDLGALLNLSPNDIESVEVLKDASATAIWGAQGANGVLLITTKKGNVGRTRYSYSSKFSYKFEPNTIPMLDGNQYTALMQDAIWNAADFVGYNRASNYLRLLFDTPEIGYDTNWKYFNEFNCDTEWLEEIRKNSYSFDNSISMSGGGEKATYRLSVGQLNEGGTTVGTAMSRLSTSLRIDYNFSKKLRFGANFSFSDIDRDANWASTVRSEAFRKMPNKSPYIIGADGRPTSEYFTYQTVDWEGAFSGSANYNPVAMAREAVNHTDSRSASIKIDARYEVLKGLVYTGYVSISTGSNKTTKFLPQSVTGVPWNNNYANQGQDAYGASLSIRTENKLNFIHDWNDQQHQLIATGVWRTSQSSSYSYSSATSSMASGEMSDPVVGTSVTGISSGFSERRSFEGTGLLNYTFARRYVIQGTMTISSSTAFGRNRRMAFFPGAGLSWNIQNEPWMEDVEWINEMKIRLSYGQSGNAPSGNAIYLGAFSSSSSYMDMASIQPTRMELDKLKWEVSREYDAGLDMSFHDYRLKASFDYYRKETDDLLRTNVTIPSSTGYSNIKYFNSGRMMNQGVEGTVGYDFVKTKEWTVSASVNAARNISAILELPVNMNEEQGYARGDADMRNGSYAARAIEGQPVGAFYGYHYLGVYSTTDDTYARDAAGNIMNDVHGNPIVMRNGNYTCYAGDAKYEDVNHDGVINKYDIVYLGNSQPVLTGGANLSIRFRQWTLRGTLYGRFGQSIVNTTRMNNESMYGKNNQSTAVLHRWRNEGDQTNIPRALYNEGLNYLGSSRFVEKAAYLRLKTMTLSYGLPKHLLAKTRLTSMSVYVTGYNLMTLTGYTGQDPEVSVPGNAFSYASDGASTPAAVRLNLGLNLSF